MDPSSPPIESVRVDGKVVLKLLKYGLESISNLCNGQLLGMENDSVLEVTDCYPLVSQHSSDVRDYYERILPALREANHDVFPVGSFRWSSIGTFLDIGALEGQYQNQKDMHNRITLLACPASAVNGQIILKAFKLSDKFFEYYGNHTFTASQLKQTELSFQDMWTELPVIVHNTGLINVWLSKFLINQSITNPKPVPSQNSVNAANLHSLIQCTQDSVDAAVGEVKKYKYQVSHTNKLREAKVNQGRKRTAITEPQQLPSLVALSQLSRYCSSLIEEVKSRAEEMEKVGGKA
ncbi:hypothetical protein P9112_003035 [Eukaryota sp. TZLM1-RC]